MAKITKNKQTTVIDVVAVECDRCHKIIERDDDYNFEEVFSISFIGGFASIWGDMVEVNADFCMSCSYALFGEFVSKKQH